MKKSILLFTLFLSIFANSFAQAPATLPAPAAAKATKAPNKMKDHANEKGKEQAQAGQDKAQGENKMKNDWGLTADQQTKFKALNETQKANMQKLMADKTMDAAAKDAQKAKLKAEYEAQVQAVFTPEQFTKWQAARANRDAKKGEGNKMGDHDMKGDQPKKAEGKMKGNAKKAEGKVRSDNQKTPTESH